MRTTRTIDKSSEDPWHLQRCRLSPTFPEGSCVYGLSATEKGQVCAFKPERIRNISQPFISSNSLKNRAFSEMFFSDSIRHRVLRYLDDHSKENLARISSLWRKDLQNDAVFLRRAEKILGKRAGFLDVHQFSQPAYKLVETSELILSKRIHGHALSQNEREFSAHPVWRDVNDLVLTCNDWSKKGRNYAFSCMLAFVVGFSVGIRIWHTGHFLPDGSWLGKKFPAWDLDVDRYARNVSSEFYQGVHVGRRLRVRSDPSLGFVKILVVSDNLGLLNRLYFFATLLLFYLFCENAINACTAFLESSRIRKNLCSRLT